MVSLESWARITLLKGLMRLGGFFPAIYNVLDLGS
jgi:hypothetical protein